MKLWKRKRGFSATELIVSLLVLAGLAMVGLPSYYNFKRRVYFKEAIAATVPYRVAVTQCYQKQKSLQNCNGGSHDIPANITQATGAVHLLKVQTGVISVIPVPGHGIIARDTYILTPSVVNSNLQWTASGGGIDKDYADKTVKETSEAQE